MKEVPNMGRTIAAAGWSKVLFYMIQFTWGLPVNLAGLLIFLCCKRSHYEKFCNSVVIYLPGDRGGLSLGIFIFLSLHGEDERRRLCIHEYGHTIQCLFLGPLYWFVVAIPSAAWYHLFANFRKKHQLSYDVLYCEHWATVWGEKWSGIKERQEH